MNQPRTAIIGYGHAGRQFHTYLVGLCDELALQGIASRNPETRQRIESEVGCKAYDGLEAVLDDEQIDLVVLASPSHAHGEQAIAAFKAGKHVVTDKPMATNLAEADAMIAAARAADRQLFVFQNRRWDGDYLTVKKLMTEGPLTNTRRIETSWAAFRMPGGWRGKAEAGGGRIYDLASHMIDQLVVLWPQAITSVYAKLQYDSDEHDVESDAVIIIGYEDGATAVVNTGAINATPKPRWYLTGPTGTFVKHGLDPQENAMKAGNIDAAREHPADFGTLNTTGKPEDDQRIKTEAGRWRCFYEDVAECLTTGKQPAVSLDSVRRQLAVIDAVYESHRTGQVVAIDIAALT